MHKQKFQLVFLFFIVAMASLLVGCANKIAETAKNQVSDKIAEKIAEKTLEKSLGNNAQVDINSNQLKVKTDQGSFEVGNDVHVPDGFPSDVYIIDGQLKTAANNYLGNNGYTLSIETTKSVAAVKEIYDQKLKESGWNIIMSLVYGESATISGSKQGRSVSVIINKVDEKTNVIIGVAPNK